MEVNERGSEAAAATAFTAIDGCSMYEPLIEMFVADHPFLFCIVDERVDTGNVLFTGRVMRPPTAAC